MPTATVSALTTDIQTLDILAEGIEKVSRKKEKIRSITILFQMLGASRAPLLRFTAANGEFLECRTAAPRYPEERSPMEFIFGYYGESAGKTEVVFSENATANIPAAQVDRIWELLAGLLGKTLEEFPQGTAIIMPFFAASRKS